VKKTRAFLLPLTELQSTSSGQVETITYDEFPRLAFVHVHAGQEGETVKQIKQDQGIVRVAEYRVGQSLRELSDQDYLEPGHVYITESSFVSFFLFFFVVFLSLFFLFSLEFFKWLYHKLCTWLENL
jgi:hypothetical protein